jgi:hypothetical protein
MRLATSRYAESRLIIASGLAAVATSVGLPKFPTGYRLADHAKLLAPFGLLGIDDEAEFTIRYRAQLERHGVAKILRVLTGIANRENRAGVALLCFEPTGEFCHRRVLASWIEEHTGQRVPELGESICPDCHGPWPICELRCPGCGLAAEDVEAAALFVDRLDSDTDE